MMEPFRTVTSRVAPFPEPNVDTDQIIPKQFLKLVSRAGFGKHLFHDRRGPGFFLDDPRYADCRILAAGDNFGCGSSREHAVWALKDHGFAVIVSTSFADIFNSNCIKNGILPVRLPPDEAGRVMAERGPVTVDLGCQEIRMPDCTIPFRMDPYQRMVLLEGLDEIARTLGHESLISAYERNRGPPSLM